MGYINRFLLFLYALAIAVLSIVLVIICLNIVPAYVLFNEIKYLLSCRETLIGAGVALLWSIYLIGCSLCSGSNSGKTEKDVILLKGTTGEVRLSAEAVKNMVERVGNTVSGVREIKADVSAHNDADNPRVIVDIQAILSHEKNVTVVSDEIRTVVSRDLEQVAGISDYSVKLSIKDISNLATTKKQRVL